MNNDLIISIIGLIIGCLGIFASFLFVSWNFAVDSYSQLTYLNELLTKYNKKNNDKQVKIEGIFNRKENQNYCNNKIKTWIYIVKITFFLELRAHISRDLKFAKTRLKDRNII